MGPYKPNGPPSSCQHLAPPRPRSQGIFRRARRARVSGCNARLVRVLESHPMNERQQSHIDYYLRRLEYWEGRKPSGSTPKLLAARDADETHPLRSEEEATEVVEYLWRLEREEDAT